MTHELEKKSFFFELLLSIITQAGLTLIILWNCFTDVEAVVDYGHEVVALVGPRPAYVNRLQRRRPKTIDDHALYARRIGYYGASGPFGRECAMMGLDQEADRFIQAFYAELIRTCPTNSGGLFGTSHQQVQDVNEINKLMGRLRNEINKMMSRLRIEILPVAVAMTRKMVAALTMSQQAAPANKHQKIHVVEAGCVDRLNPLIYNN